MHKWSTSTPGIPRPGQCYLCRKRPGQVFHRHYWACRQCMSSMFVKDVLAIVIAVATIALAAVVAKAYGYCPVCPAVHLPALRLPHAPKHH